MICKYCKKYFKIRQRKYCSMKCSRIGRLKDRNLINCLNCKNDFIPKFPFYENKQIYCSTRCVYQSVEYRKKRKEIGLRMKPEKSFFWKGGICKINFKIRASSKYREWREEIFKRDNWTCQICFKRGGIKLNADHIKPFSYYPEYRFDLSNGRTLCVPCHRKTDTYGIKATKIEYQFS